MNIAKEFFDRYQRLNARIDGLLDEQSQVKARACGMIASYSDEPRDGSGVSSKVESGVVRIIELEDRINAWIDELVDHRLVAEQVISELPSTRHRDVLGWRYHARWNWDKIAEALGADRSTAWRIHGRALTAANLILQRPEYENAVARVLDDVKIHQNLSDAT